MGPLFQMGKLRPREANSLLLALVSSTLCYGYSNPCLGPCRPQQTPGGRSRFGFPSVPCMVSRTTLAPSGTRVFITFSWVE